MIQIDNFINGRFVPPLAGEYFVKFNPSNGEPQYSVAVSKEVDAQVAVRAAQEAYPNWSKLKISERILHLRRVADLIEKHFDEFAIIESEDTGKPISLCKELDIPRSIANFRFFCDFLESEKEEFFENQTAHNYVLRRPIGVVALITPWNLPLYLLTWKLAPALLMGNTVVAKPSELTSRSALKLCEIFNIAGIPNGVFNALLGPGGQAAEPLITDPLVKAVSFTGGTKTGARVAELAAKNMKKVSLELGGKNSTIVFADADLSEAAKGVARSSFLNQGQICLCGERIFIQSSVYNEFIEKLIGEAKEYLPQNPSDPRSKFGALISQTHLEKVKAYIDLAVSEGGKILFGGKTKEPGFYLEPTIISGLSTQCRTTQEEIFGPVITLHSFEDINDVIIQANNTRYGLSASVWTTNKDCVTRLGEELEVGTLWINSWLLRDLRVPFGGVKSSGLGREGGRYSLEFFSELKTVCIKKGTL